jgi:hypothetical protein
LFAVFVSPPGKGVVRQIANTLSGSSKTGCWSETGSSKSEIKTAVFEMEQGLGEGSRLKAEPIEKHG